MNSQPTKVLAPTDLRRLLATVAKGRYGVRNRVVVLLSVKAGLRACEIAHLTWQMITNAKGQIADSIELPAASAKMGSGRRIPMHPKLKRALRILASASFTQQDAVIQSERGGQMTAKSIVNWFKKQYVALNLVGCSSHSGRRTFVTNAARQVYRAGGSLRDVQILAGHRSIRTTQIYIEGSSNAQRRLVHLI